MMAMGPVAAWHTEHVYFNQLLELLKRQLDLFHRGASPNYELMLDIVPVLLGAGERLFGGVKDPGLHPVEVIHSPHATHVRYRVGR